MGLRIRVALALLPAAMLVAQAPIGQPSFEVASVKPAAPNQRSSSPFGGGPGTRDPGRMSGTNVALIPLLTMAFGVDRIDISGPTWLSQARYDIAASVPEGTTLEQLPLMIQRLLSERFGMVAHKETREMPAFVLTVVKGGHKFKENKDESLQPRRSGAGVPPLDRDGYPVFEAGTTGGAGKVTEGVMRQTTVGQPISTLIDALRIDLGSITAPARIVDKTGLTGKYDYRMEYQISSRLQTAPAPEFGGPTLQEALEKQLGLKVEKGTVAVEMLIIDRMERVPTEN
jgi:uncharacterized protein (TIGR03435 family)